MEWDLKKNSRMVSFDLDTWVPKQKVNSVKFLWSKMACTWVLHIVLHVLCGTRTSGVHFRPPKVSFSAIFAISGVFFYKAFFQNWFFQNPLMGWFCPSGIWICTSMHHLCKAKKTSMKHFFRSHVPDTCGSNKVNWQKRRKTCFQNTFFCFSFGRVWHLASLPVTRVDAFQLGRIDIAGFSQDIIQEWKNGAKLMIFINRITRSESLASITRWTSFSRMLVLWFYG